MDKCGLRHLRETLQKQPSCYVLITCGEPTEDGQMHVEMTYQGPSDLASYLLHGAQEFIDQDESQKLAAIPEKYWSN